MGSPFGSVFRNDLFRTLRPFQQIKTRLLAVVVLVGQISLPLNDRAAEDGPSDSAATLARHAIANRDFQTAEQLIGVALQKQPADADWLVLKADLNASKGHVTAALTQIQGIIRLHPNHRRSRFREAQLYSELGRLRTAEEKYRAYLEQSPSDLEARVGLGLTLFWRGDWHNSEEIFSEVVRQAPDKESALYAGLRALVAEGRISPAWQIARAYDEKGGRKDGELGLILATIANRVGAWKLAEPLASRRTEDPDLRRRQIAFRAMHYVQHGEHARGLDLIAPFAHLDSLDYDALMDVANAYAAADQRAAARAYYERAAAVTPERADAHLGLARLASRDGRLTSSLAIYEKIVADNPESFEGWLGVIRTGQLLNEPMRVASAINQVWQIAPGSALLHREELRLALQAGDTARFAAGLEQYLADQPEDSAAHLWRQRWMGATGQPLQVDVLKEMLDPLSPDISSQALRLLLTGDEDRKTILSFIPRAPERELQAPANEALAEQLAILLQRKAATEIAGRAAPESAWWINALGNGWWAYVSTPLACRTELSEDFDSQALTVWLAGEIQRRLRTLQVETESSLWDEWLMRRAHWFDQWRNKWGSQPAAMDLMRSLAGLTPDWTNGVGQMQIDEAWRTSGQATPADSETFPQLIARARWHQYRFQFAAALTLLKRLQSEYPLAIEPAQRRVEILRSQGRWAEAADVLRRLASDARPSPSVRLRYADLLRRMGRRSEARHQLDLLREEGFDEPEFYIQEAALAESMDLKNGDWDWIQEGLRRQPRAPGLLALEADWFLRKGQPRQLAELLAVGDVPAWIDPRIVAAAWPYLSFPRREKILHSPQWWLGWQWLPWERLEKHSLAELQKESDRAAADGAPADALAAIQPAMTARLPDSDFWLRAARLLDQNQRVPESDQAFRFATLLGCGRPDADAARLTQLARRDPREAVKEFAERLEEQPDDRSLRVGLVLALLRAGQATAAVRELAPLTEEDPDDPEVRMLAAQVKGATGRVRQARSLYESLLREDPLSADIRAGKLALNQTFDSGATIGYEYDRRNDSTGSGAGLSDWQEGYISAFWRRPFAQTFSAEYHWYDRGAGQQAHQLLLEWSRALDKDWIIRLDGGPSLSGTVAPAWRVGAGTSYRLVEDLFGNLDGYYLNFSDVEVWQAVPGLTWRWHPRSTFNTRVYISENRLRSGTANQSVTWAFDNGWQLGEQSSLIFYFAAGDENSANPTRDLIGNDRLQSYGVALRLGWNHRWTLQPVYRYEIHKRFDLHAVGLSLTCRY